MTITKATWDRLLRYAEVQKRLGDALSELQEAQGGTWLDAAEVAIAVVESRTRAEWHAREGALVIRWLRWAPWRWQRRLMLNWPRKWLPKNKDVVIG